MCRAWSDAELLWIWSLLDQAGLPKELVP